METKSLLLKYRRPLIILAHLALILAAYVLAFLLRLDFRIPADYWRVMLRNLPILIVIKLVLFGYYGLFSGLWRYASVDDIWRIIKANFFSSLGFMTGVTLIFNTTGFPRSIFLLDSILCACLVAGVRFVTRLLREKFKPAIDIKQRRLLIVGAGEAGVTVLREARANPRMHVEVVGFIDDSPSKKNLRIQGYKILGGRFDIPRIVKQYLVDEIIIAIPSASGEVIRDVISHCQIPEVKIKILPGLHKIFNGEIEIKPREVKPEDLLGRETVKINEKEIGGYLKNKVVLVTGAGGTIGSELCRQICRFHPKQLILFDHNENDVYFLTVELQAQFGAIDITTIIGDIKDIVMLKDLFSRYRPEVVFHAAAHKHVPLMEFNPVAAVKNNILGTRNMIYASHHYKVDRFVLISSDKAVNPMNVMGMSKRISEMILQAKAPQSKTKFMAVRFGNVIGSAGSVVPLFKRQIESGGPITITHPDVKRYFMSVQEAVSLVLQAGALGKGGEIFILDMGQQIKITDIASNLVALSGMKMFKDIQVKFIGLRPGEKMFEELLLDNEKDRVTRHEKIFISKTEEFDSIKLRRQVRELTTIIHWEKNGKVVEKLKDIIAVR
jgi:FlaA1/EpsC-like NDP-sugar epimerase